MQGNGDIYLQPLLRRDPHAGKMRGMFFFPGRIGQQKLPESAVLQHPGDV